MQKSILASSPYYIINKSLLLSIGIDASLVLSDLIQKETYFKNNNLLVDGYFFNTGQNISCSTTLSYHQISKAIATLTKWGMIEVVRKGVPAKWHFKIYHNKILKTLKTSTKNNEELECHNFNNQLINNLNSINNNKEIIIKKKNNISQKDKFLNDIKELKPRQYIEDFIVYWTEENSRGKMRWQLEKTWNTSLRYKRWIRNNEKFDKGNKSSDPKFPDYYDIHFAKRLEQDHTALLSYYNHLRSLGYEKKVNSYDGKIKWIKR